MLSRMVATLSDTEEGPEQLSNLQDGFRLGSYTILPDRGTITPDPSDDPAAASSGDSETDQTSIHVEPKHMQVLVALAKQPRTPVTRQALLDEVWAGRVVGDEVLSRGVSLLRTALNDDRRSPWAIKTHSTGGYELIAPVTPLSAIAVEQPRGVSKRWVGIAAAAVVLLAVVAIFGWQTQTPTKLAVIPFSAPVSDQLPTGGEGLADYLISALTGSDELSVVARQASFAILGKTMDLETIGETLDADYLIAGKLLLNGSRLTLTLDLIDPQDGTTLWTARIEGDPVDMRGLQEDALAALSSGLEQHFSIEPLTATRSSSHIDDEAQQKLLEAQYQWSLRGELRINRAIELLHQAIELRPDFPEAHLALAQSLATEPFYNDAITVAERFGQARGALDMAKRQDREAVLAADISALEGMMYLEEKRWGQSRAKLEAALAINPDTAMAHYWYSRLLASLGDNARGLTHIQRAAALNPWSAVVNDRLAVAYLWADDTESATRQYAIASSLGYLESTQVGSYVVHAVRTGNWEEIRSLLVRVGMNPDWVHPFVDGLEDPEKRPDATVIIEAAMASGQVARRFWFGIWVLYEDADRAFAAFNSGEKTQDIEFLWTAESAFLRTDPRFDELLAEANLK